MDATTKESQFSIPDPLEPGIRPSKLSHMFLIRLAILLTTPCLLFAQQPPQKESSGETAKKATTEAQQQKKQKAAKAEQEREALAKAVQLAHRGKGNLTRISTFENANLKIRPLKKEGDSFEVKLRADFISPRWIRYSIEESGKLMQEGWDEDGPWSRVDGDRETVSLEGKDTEQERDNIKKRRRLARQILGFLDPARVIRNLKDISEIRHNLPIQVGRMKKVQCLHIEGSLDSYPLYFAQGEGQKVRLHIWIDEKKMELVAVQANAIAADKKPSKNGEFVLLARSQFHNKVLLPTILVFSRTQGTRQRPEVQVDIVGIKLGGSLDKKDLRRPKN